MTPVQLPEVPVREGAWYRTASGHAVQVWRITQDEGCYCSDMKHHCASELTAITPSENNSGR